MATRFRDLSRAHTGRVFHCAWRPASSGVETKRTGSPDFATASEDGTAVLWDTTRLAGNCRVVTLRDHSRGAEVLRVAFGREWFATGGADGTANLYKLRDLDSSLDSAAGAKVSVRLEHEHRNVPKGGQLYGLLFPQVPASDIVGATTGGGGSARAGAGGGGGETALLTCMEDTVFAWDLGASGGPSVVASFTFAPALSRVPFGGTARNPAGSNLVFDISSLPSSQPGCESLFAAALSDGTAAVVDLRTGTAVARVGSHARHCTCVAARGLGLREGEGGGEGGGEGEREGEREGGREGGRKGKGGGRGEGGCEGERGDKVGVEITTSGAGGDILVHDLRFSSISSSSASSSNTKLRCRISTAHQRSLYGCLWLPSADNTLLSWSADGTVRLWDAAAKEGERKTSTALRPDPSCTSIYFCAASADGRLAIVGEAEVEEQEEEEEEEEEEDGFDERSPFAIPTEWSVAKQAAASQGEENKHGKKRKRPCKRKRGAVYIGRIDGVMKR